MRRSRASLRWSRRRPPAAPATRQARAWRDASRRPETIVRERSRAAARPRRCAAPRPPAPMSLRAAALRRRRRPAAPEGPLLAPAHSAVGRGRAPRPAPRGGCLPLPRPVARPPAGRSCPGLACRRPSMRRPCRARVLRAPQRPIRGSSSRREPVVVPRSRSAPAAPTTAPRTPRTSARPPGRIPGIPRARRGVPRHAQRPRPPGRRRRLGPRRAGRRRAARASAGCPRDRSSSRPRPPSAGTPPVWGRRCRCREEWTTALPRCATQPGKATSVTPVCCGAQLLPERTCSSS